MGELLANLGIYSVEDLLYLFPFRYEDRSQFTPIAMLSALLFRNILQIKFNSIDIFIG